MPYIAADDRRRLIIDAAIEVMAKEGLARTTTRRIAEKADAPLGALHYCFRNKAELMDLVAERGAERLVEAFAPVDPSRGIEATIRECIDAMWRWYQENIGLAMALTEAGMARIRQGGDPEEVYAIWNRFGRDLLTSNLEQAAASDDVELGVPLPEIVRFILHRFDGLTLEYAASRDETACQRQVDLLADALVAVALPERSRAATART